MRPFLVSLCMQGLGHGSTAAACANGCGKSARLSTGLIENLRGRNELGNLII